MGQTEADEPARLAVLETKVESLTNSLNRIADSRDRVITLEGKVAERERQEGLFWVKYGVYATIAAATVGGVVGIVGTLAALGKL